MRISFRKKAVVIDGKPRLVLAGEVQYFRTPRANWAKVLKRLKEAHCDCVSTYVPWSWHEVEDGEFDFAGRTHEGRDVKTFLDLAADMGFAMVLKPGPFVFGEIANGGIPPWFSASHPEALARGPDGKLSFRVKFQHVSYTHPTYLRYARRWLSESWKVLRAYRDRTVTWQVDNEICYSYSLFWGTPFAADYNGFIVKNGVYQRWLRRKFGAIGRLNDRYRSKWRSFSAVQAPVRQGPGPGELCRALDWIEFREWMAVENVKQCCDHLRREGVPGPFSVNAPFCAWGPAWVNVARWLKNPRYQVILSHVDYPGVLYEANLGESIGLAHFARAAGNVADVNVETQACTVSKIWGKHGTSYDLTHKTVIGSGLNMINYYWFNDGVNYLGTGHYQENHEFECPLDINGDPRPHYFQIKRLNSFLAAHPAIASLRPRGDVLVGFLHDWGRMDFACQKKDPGWQSRTTMLMNYLSACGVTFDVADLKVPLPGGRPGTILVQSGEFMPRSAMRALVAHVRRGGHLVLSNFFPWLDEHMEPCDILSRALGVRDGGVIPPKPGGLEPNKVRIFGMEPFVIDRLQAFVPGPGAEPLAACEGKCVGFKTGVGKGSATVLGYRLEYVLTDIHRRILGRLLGRDLSAPGIVLERTGPEGNLKTVLNFHDEPRTIPVDGHGLRLPGKLGAFILRERGRRYVFR